MKIKSPITGSITNNCEVFNCKNKAFKSWGGGVFCKKCYEKELIKWYGSLEKAKKYILSK